ncbi:MAG TPA: phage recombination protein Bet [Oligoflexus sp.]|uniref:phage recombination protein Bet n=1 Tax=Oligoflexus sp. TaxID=1971216 RepID=UPI002D22CF1D|nr:phage recombination protein Bet [Oligoflexus sp.]HYX35810.1 phage recombination protein Bet [Oligoflexus sp.]
MLPARKDQSLDYFTPDKIDFLRRHYAKDATPEEFEHFVEVCRSRSLRPDARQIYFMKVAGRASIVLSIDAYRLIAQRTGCYVGINPVQYVLDGEGRAVSATITVKKLVQGHICEFSGTALFSEYYKPGRDGRKSLWDSMPMSMLEKCAEAKALRKAFPEELSGYYTRDEMEGADEQTSRSVHVEPVVQTADPRIRDWIQRKLNEACVPETEWASILDSLNGYPKNELLAALKKIIDARKGGDGDAA